jgi:peptide/nickel transport system ATP-binding protein
MPSDPLLALDGIRLSLARPGMVPFRRPPRVEILHGVSLTVARGEAVGIVGESGSGKTSLARVIAGIYGPDAGTVRFDGADVATLPKAARQALRTRVQMIFQDTLSALNPRKRIGETILRPLQAAGWRASRAEKRDRAAALIARVGLPQDAIDRFPHELSGGQRQRVGIARAIAPEPLLIVADEIVSGLDVSTQAQILGLLGLLQAQLGLAIVFISHDLAVVRHVCARVAVMREGRVVEEGPSAAIFAAPQHPYTKALIAAVPPLRPDQLWLARDQSPSNA